jgi:hypothetical protein
MPNHNDVRNLIRRAGDQVPLDPADRSRLSSLAQRARRRRKIRAGVATAGVLAAMTPVAYALAATTQHDRVAPGSPAAGPTGTPTMTTPSTPNFDTRADCAGTTVSISQGESLYTLFPESALTPKSISLSAQPATLTITGACADWFRVVSRDPAVVAMPEGTPGEMHLAAGKTTLQVVTSACAGDLTGNCRGGPVIYPAIPVEVTPSN